MKGLIFVSFTVLEHSSVAKIYIEEGDHKLHQHAMTKGVYNCEMLLSFNDTINVV